MATQMITVIMHNEERSNLSCCTNIIRIMKQRNLAYVGEKENVLHNLDMKIWRETYWGGGLG